jgi:preprotein translocase subunit SecF
MELLANSKIDFMGMRRPMVVLSSILVVLSLASLLGLGTLNVGIDFAGGTQLVLRFKDEPQVDELRSLLAAAQIDDALIQRFGEDLDNEVLIKTPLVSGQEEGSREQVVAALGERFNPGASGLDLNQEGAAALASVLLRADPDGQLVLGEDEARIYYEEIGTRVMAVRSANGLISDWSELDSLELSPALRQELERSTTIGAFAVLGAENVGPQIGSELRSKGVLAVVFSLLGMLAYIWYRFELRFGLGAVAALMHDVIIGLGL